MSSIGKMLQDKAIDIKEALEIFDELSPVTPGFMLGRWKGFEIATNHPMDGLLNLTGWYGKLFINEEKVHPLLFSYRKGKALYAVNPTLIPLEINFPKIIFLKFLMLLLKPLLQTKNSSARIRMIEYRGKLTGTMAYDNKAIFDHFVKINDNMMLGIMDLKNSPAPYVFILERDNTDIKINL